MARPTIKDVAREAGVSINTVSRALNDKPDVSAETRKAVLKAARELGYVPNKLARRLRANRTGVYGVIVADIANPFFSVVVKGMEEATKSLGCSLILQDSGEDFESELRAINTMQTEQVDAVLITPCRCKAGSIDALRAAGVPFVLVGRYFEDARTDYVCPDDEHAGYLATAHLLEQGHRRIAFINGPQDNSSAADRRQGHERALQEQGIPFSLDLIRDNALTIEAGYVHALDILDQAEDRPTAVFAFNDIVALGAMRAARERHLRIPQDIAVVGCDDIVFGSYLEVPLTTVCIPKRDMGRTAVGIAEKKLAGETRISQIKMPVELVVRGSS